MATGSKVEPPQSALERSLDVPVAGPGDSAGQHGGFITWAERTFSSLGNRDFRFLWFGMLLSMGGFQMQMIARGILVYEMTDSQFLTAVVAMGFAPSLLIVSLFGGVLGDRMERRLIIQIGQGTNAIIAGLVAVLVISGSVHWTHLLAVSMVQGAMFALQMPARQAAIPRLVGKERVGNAVALNAMAMSLMNIAAPGIGGVIYHFGGPEAAYLTVTAMMVIAVLVTGMIPKMYPSGDAARQSVLENIKGGFSYARRNRIVRVLLIYSIMLALLSMPFRMLIPVFAKDIYGVEAGGVGLLASMIGIGGVSASILSASLRKGQHRGLVLLSAGIISGVSLLFIAALPFYVVGAIFMIGIGFGETIRWGLGQALIMEETDDEYRSRMMSLLMMSFGLMPIAVLPLGFAVEKLGAQPVVYGMAIVLLAASVLYTIVSKSLRKME